MGADSSTKTVSPWAKRIRAILRSAPDVAVPAFTFIALIVFIAGQLSSQPLRVAPGQNGTNTTFAGNTAQLGRPTGDQQPQALSIAVPEVSAEVLNGFRPAWSLIGLFLTAIITILLLARRITTAKVDQIEDSDNFREALRIWHPVVFASDPTPRGVKRHQNRLRLQAMRLRPAQEELDLFDRWFTRANVEAQIDASASISEPTLVALGAIDALFDGLPSWSLNTDEKFQISKLTNPQTSPMSQTEQAHTSIVLKCRQTFLKVFPSDWPPKEQAIAAFRALRRSL